MGKGRAFTISFANTSGIFYPGQPVQGEVLVQVQDEVKIREIRLEFGGFAHVHWSESHGSGKHRRTVHYSSREEYFKVVVPCLSPPHGEEKMMLQPGSYRYPFQFQIPPSSPSSFEGGIGRVRYYVKGTMDKPWAFDVEDVRYFTVLNLLDLNPIPEAKQGQEAQDSKTLCCLCCASGPISGKHNIPVSGYVPGEAIQINAELINHSNRNCEIWMELVQSIRYITARKTRTVNTVVQKTTARTVGKGDSDYWRGEQITVPPLPSTGLHGCNIIDITYFWVLVCDPSGPAINLRVNIPIIIGGIPLVSAAQLYGNVNPMNTGTSSFPSPFQVFPENVPQPVYASFSTGNNLQNPGQADNTVAPSGDNQQDDTFTPQYPYYNWNSYDTTFKPTSF